MSVVAAAVIGSAVVGGVASSAAASKAAKAQGKAADAGIAAQERQAEAMRELLNPYVQAGSGIAADPGGAFDGAAYLAQNPDVAADPIYSQNPEEHYRRFGQAEGRARPLTTAKAAQPGALQGQQDLIGLNGNAAQQASIDALRNSPMFTSMLQQGENSILQTASATGGLRGGNTQAALAQFSPALLAQTINDQYARLGGLTSLGQNAAAGVGNAGMKTSNSITELMQLQGSAQAGNAIGQGRAIAGIANGFASGAGVYAGAGGFGQQAGAGTGFAPVTWDSAYGGGAYSAPAF